MRSTAVMFVVLVLMSVGVGVGMAEQATSAPSTQPATATSQPASTPGAASQPVLSPEVEAILDKLEKKRGEIKSLESDLRYELWEMIPDSRRTQVGLLRYKAETPESPAKFMVRYDTLIADGMKVSQKEWYCFDGHTLREVQEQTKHVKDVQLVKEGERVDPFELGKGPFPLPFGQKKEEMVRNFRIELAEPETIDGVETVHLKLVPLPDSRLAKAYRRVEFWLDKKDDMPKRVVAEDLEDNVTTATFANVKSNMPLKDADLWSAEPAGYSYEREVVTE